MMALPSKANLKAPRATRDDLLRIVGDVDERKVLDILALHPTIVELEEVASLAAGDADILAKSGRALSRIATEMLDILTADEEEEGRPSIL